MKREIFCFNRPSEGVHHVAFCYGGATNKPSTLVRYSLAVSADRTQVSSRNKHELLYIYQQQFRADEPPNAATTESPARCTQIDTTIILRKVIITILLNVFVHSCLSAQIWDKTNGCITDTIKDTEAIFTRFTSEPRFKGNMKWFLTKNISLDIFLHSMQSSDTVFVDTARFQFLMSKTGEISNVTISKAKSQIFQTEVMRLFRLSSCSWERGDQGGRYVNGWAQFEIYFRLTRKYGEIKSIIDYRQIVPVDIGN